MYGTIAHFRVKPGTRDEFIRVMDSFGNAIIPGWMADYYFQMDRDPDEWRFLETMILIKQMLIHKSNMKDT